MRQNNDLFPDKKNDKTNNEQQKKKRYPRIENQYKAGYEELLNFQYTDNDFNLSTNTYPKTEPRKLSSQSKAKLKLDYIKGNFRFLVNPNFPNEIRYFHPDQEINWDFIELVKYITNSKIVCPICLNDPEHMIVPLITKCGHIYCWPCILQYLAYSINLKLSNLKAKEKTRCPLCNEFLIENDFKFVIIKYIPTYHKQKDIISLNLKKRNKNESIILHNEDYKEDDEFCRIKKIDSTEILELYETQKKTLTTKLTEVMDNNEKEIIVFITQALTDLQKKISDIESKINANKNIKKNKIESLAHNTGDNNVSGGVIDYYKCDQDDFYYFYQESNALNIFLHPICYKYLKMQYNNNCYYLPKNVESLLVDIESLQQNEKTKKRYKFLNHITLHTEIQFAVIEMSHLLNPEIYQLYDIEINEHKKYCRPTEPSPSIVPAKVDYNTNSMVSTKDKKTQESEYREPIILPPDVSELKLNDEIAYPELPKANDEEKKELNQKIVDHPYLKLQKQNKNKDETKKAAKPQQKKEEFKTEDDYIVKENSSTIMLSDFLVISTSKKKKKKQQVKLCVNGVKGGRTKTL